MYRAAIRVRGSGVDDLPATLYEELTAERKGSVERYSSDGFEVIVVERFYLRNNSDQQATIVFDEVDDETAVVTVLAGGGGAGLFQLNLGSHSTHGGKLLERVGTICEAANIDVAAYDEPRDAETE